MSYLETSEGSCYSSVYAIGGGTHLLSSTLRDSAPCAGELAWGGRGSSSLTGASSAVSASCETYTSAASVSREEYGGATFVAARGSAAGLLVEERTETVAEEEETGRRVTETVRRALAQHRGSGTFRDALECSGGSEQTEGMAGGSEPAGTAEGMSAEEAEERVRGLYRRLRGADHFRSLPALDRPTERRRPRPDPRADSPADSAAEVYRVRRPVPHFAAELSVVAIHTRLRARLAALRHSLEEPLRGDLHKYVEFIGTSCLDPEDETVKREMAEKVMRLLLQREGGSETGDAAACTQDTSQPSQLSESAVTAESACDAGRDRWPVTAPFSSRVPSPYSRERPGSPEGQRRTAAPPPRDRRGSAAAAEQEEQEEAERPIGAWRHQMTRSERRLQASAAADGDESEASEAAWHSHNYSGGLHDTHQGRQTDTTSSDYDFNTIRSRQRRLEDATASSFEYYDHGPRRRSSPDEGASAPEATVRSPCRSPARAASPPPPCPAPACEKVDHSDLLRLLRHTTDNVIRHSRETRTFRTPVPPSTSSDAAPADVRRRPRSRDTRGGHRCARSTSGEGSRQLGAMVGEHRQKHVQQLQHEIAKLGRLERLLLGGSTVDLDGCDSSEDGAAGTGSGCRRGVEGRSSPSDSDPPPEPSSAYSRIRDKLQRRRRQIEAQLTEMDCRHRQYSRRPDQFSDLPEEVDSEEPPRRRTNGSRTVTTRSSSQRRTAAGTSTGTSSQRRTAAGTSTGTSSRRPRASSASQRRTASSQETTTQTSRQTSRQTSSQRRSTRSSQCDLGSPSVQVYTRRSRVPGSDTGTQTASGGPEPAGAAVQVFTRRTRLPPPSDSTTQATSTATRCQPTSSGSRSASGGSRRRRSASSPRRTVTVTRRQVPRDARRPGSGSPTPRRSHMAVQTSSPERTATVTRRRVVPEEPSPPSPPRLSSAVETITRRRKLPGRRTEPAVAAEPPSASRREVVVRRRPLTDGGSAETETVTTTTANTTASTTPTTVRSSVTNEEGMRDALEPSDRSCQRAGDLERAQQLLEAVGESVTASRTADDRDISVSSRSGGSSLRSGSLSGRSGLSSCDPTRSPDARRAECLLREGVRVDELDRALWKADFCQEFPSCPASPRRDLLGSSEESRSVATQTGLLAAPPRHGDRCETVRRQVHSDDSEVIHHPPRPPSARRSVAYFLSVRRGPLCPPPCDEEERCRRVLPAVRLSQELLRQQGLATTCSDSPTGTECVREEDEQCSEEGQRVSVTQRRPAGLPSAAECVSLQEALCRHRPDYIRNAAVRRQYLLRLAELRQGNLERVARAAQTLPDVPTDADWCHFTDAMRPENVRRAFDYRDMRQHTERLWRRLPEIRDCVSSRKKHAQFRTNRLMWQVYRQKLQERCLRGDLHMTHRDAVLGGI